MNFQPQPYPLFFACLSDGKIAIGRVIGWSVPDADSDIDGLEPVACCFKPDGSITGPIYLIPSEGSYWIDEDLDRARSQAVTAQQSQTQ